MKNKTQHWNEVYEQKQITEVSWYEPMPETSLSFITECKLEKDAAIIDVGGGDSFLAEFLVAQGFSDITVLDISEKAIERAKERLGEKAEEIKWIVADASEFTPEKKYDLWHDRAAFHFLTEEGQVQNYLKNVSEAVKPGGYVIIGCFSEEGPKTCSGLEIKQYSIDKLQQLFAGSFSTMSCKNVEHHTPSGATQDFTFCSFRKRNRNTTFSR